MNYLQMNNIGYAPAINWSVVKRKEMEQCSNSVEQRGERQMKCVAVYCGAQQPKNPLFNQKAEGKVPGGAVLLELLQLCNMESLNSMACRVSRC